MKDTVSKIFPEESEIVSPPLFDIGEPVKPLFEDFVEPEPEKPEIADPTQPMEFSPPLAGAIISPCGLFRYTLWRRFKEERTGEKRISFGCLNPSKADAVIDDNSVKRMCSFAKREDAALLTVWNLFPFRATDPKKLLALREKNGDADDQYSAFVRKAIGEVYGSRFKDRYNTQTIKQIVEASEMVILAWGNGGSLFEEGRGMWNHLSEKYANKLFCLGVTKLGHPRHPLRLSSKTKIVPFTYSATNPNDCVFEEPL